MRRLLAAVLCFLLLGAGCSGGGGTDPARISGPGAPPTLLAGDPSSGALAALSEVRSAPVPPEDVDAGVLLTRLFVVLDPEATVGDLNAAAEAAGATGFAFARPGSPFLDLAVPRQADLAGLEALAARLDGLPGILFAEPAREAAATELPHDDQGEALEVEIGALLRTRFPGAWNARRLAASAPAKVTVLVPDMYFGQHEQFDRQLEGAAILLDPVTRQPTDQVPPGAGPAHGFQVVGTLAALFDSQLSHGANPVPSQLQIRMVNARGRSFLQVLDDVRFEVERAPGPVILSSSLAFAVPDPDSTDVQLRRLLFGRFLQACSWAGFVTRPGIADRLLIVQAAGNERNDEPLNVYPGLANARLSSPFGTATVMDSLDAVLESEALWNPPGAPHDLRLEPANRDRLARLRDSELAGRTVTDRNFTAVGSLTLTPDFADLEESAFSNAGADLFAVGEGVHTVTLAEADPTGGLVAGTSFSTPQVAGLASYLWLLDDSLAQSPVAETLELIRGSTLGNSHVDRIMDAYGAVLALDQRGVDLRIRRELLDVVPESPGFDESDLQEFERRLALGISPIPEPPLPNFGRFDLNGDGFSGGTGTEAFDLDADGDASETLQVEVEGETVSFEESALTDLDILTWYAYVTGPGGGPLLYDDSGPNALSERARILAREDRVPVGVKVLGDGSFSTTTATHFLQACDTGSLVQTFAPVGESPLPFTLTAAETSFEITEPSPGVVDVNFSTSLPARLDCGAPHLGIANGQANVFLSLDIPDGGIVRATVAVQQPQGAPFTSTVDFAPGRRLFNVGSIVATSEATPLVITDLRVIRITFSRLP